mmetsp:Transcript_11118/g.23020  ORF Transcript_11118/g.23020 Transcript_11118/m.23020 type:complete len:208 (+) Transcript_11118:139-762(+)
MLGPGEAQVHHPVVAEHDPAPPAGVDEPLDRPGPLLPLRPRHAGLGHAGPRAVQAQPDALLQHGHEVVQVCGVVAVAYVHAVEVHALLLKDRDLGQTHVLFHLGVRRDGQPRGLVRTSHGPADHLAHAGEALAPFPGHASLVRALDDACADAGALNALGGLAYEDARHLIRLQREEAAAGIQPKARGGYDVDATLLGDAGHCSDIAA